MASSPALSATLFTDPACPWGYSENPALRVIEWRYGGQIDWRLVLVGLSERLDPAAVSGEAVGRGALSQLRYRERYGMPFAPGVRTRRAPSSRACRALVATRREHPGSEWHALRALQIAHFTSPLLFDDDAQMIEALSCVPGLDAPRIVGLIDSPEIVAEYEADKQLTRSAEGSATELQGKAGNSDGAVRYTAPSVIFTRRADGLALEAGGFQPVEAYDVLVANLDPGLDRRRPPEDVGELLAHFRYGLSTQEVAQLLVRGNDPVDRLAAERALLGLLYAGRAERHPVGDDALWTLPGGPHAPRVSSAPALSSATG